MSSMAQRLSIQPARASVEAACSQLFEASLNPDDTLCIALSGGLDSMVLLESATQLREPLGFNLTALHVHHGLSPNADAWSQFCLRQCDQRGIRLKIVGVAIERTPGASLEALARDARYAEYSAVDATVIAVAHHLDDQSETFLLQLLRGAGMRGLSAMSATSGAGNMKIVRPLLGLPRTTLQRYADDAGLEWIEDESNAMLQFDRNYLRHQILPAIARRFKGYRAALARSARHAAEAEVLLRELAEIDLAGAVSNNRLSCARLGELPAPRARNALRGFLVRFGTEPPSSARISEIVRQVTTARRDAAVCVGLGRYSLRRFRDELWLTPTFVATPDAIELLWQGESQLRVPGLGGMLSFRRTTGQGLRSSAITRLVIRSRAKNTPFQPDCKRPHRSLKNLFQEARIPPWQRNRIPLIYLGDILVAVPGLGYACEYQARSSEDGWTMEWHETTPAEAQSGRF